MIIVPPQGFPKQARLLQKTDFDRVFKCSSYRIKQRFFLILVATNHGSFARLGLITPKKYNQKAVDRNQAKRLCRAYFCAANPQLPALDIVILIKNVSGEGVWGSFRLSLREIFQQMVTHAANNQKNNGFFD